MLIVHDNICTGYRFSGDSCQLVLETTYADQYEKAGERTDIVFSGVWCHHIESVQNGNIIFDIEQVEIHSAISDFDSVFARLKNHGWPKTESKKDDLASIIDGKNLTVFRIGSSYGMEGLVVAESVRQTNREQTAGERRPSL